MDDKTVPVNPAYRRYVYDSVTDERIRINAVCERVWFMSNISSNGDIVPCCYDYGAELKIGNAFENPFSQVWNGTAYQKLRKRVYLEKDHIPQCAHCDINFQYSQSGWFVETHDFNPDKRQRINNYLRQVRRYMIPLARK